MTEPVNLNKARKARARLKKRVQADENAARFGRTKAEKARDRDEAARALRQVEAHRREREDGDA